MGLDMYLYAERYVSGYSFQDEAQQSLYQDLIRLSGLGDFACEDSPSVTVQVTAAYWRKANAIHSWFVQNVQNGTDDCGEYECGSETLQELVDTCKQAIALFEAGNKTGAEELLTPTSGFFFGSTDLDEYYLEDLKRTVKQLTPLLPFEKDGMKIDPFEGKAVWFKYHSSW